MTDTIVPLRLHNNCGADISEYWIGHSIKSDGKGAEKFFRRVVVNVNETVDVGDITLTSNTKDYWLCYWVVDNQAAQWTAGANGLMAAAKEWFKAEAQTADGTVTITLNPVGGSVNLDQQRILIGSETVIRLAAMPPTPPFRAKATRPPLSIDNIFRQAHVALPRTPGNVGICLSGGGSRAMSAGMGQLRALAFLTTRDKKSLLSQTKAISVVSGGAWVGIPFLYLKTSGDKATTDDQYLNVYVENQARLTPTGNDPATALDRLPVRNIGNVCFKFTSSAIARAIIALRAWPNPPNTMIWQTIIGRQILAPYGLYDPDPKTKLPTTTFSYNEDTWYSIVADNGRARIPPAELYTPVGSSHSHRPYFICNIAMVVNAPGDKQYLAPVQATPFITGVIGDVDAKDAAGQRVGGGGITSFAFNSILGEVRNDVFLVEQQQPWSLTDIVGTTSSALAANSVIEAQAALDDPVRARQFMDPAAWARDLDALGDSISPQDRQRVELLVKTANIPGIREILGSALKFMIPEYEYWPVRDPKPSRRSQKSQFIDGGALDNTGIAGMLAYHDIEHVVSFINSKTALVASAKGVLDEVGVEIPGTNILIDDQIPPLFGYAPYDAGVGYKLYEKDAESLAVKVHIFQSDQFPELLEGLWAAAGNPPPVHGRLPANSRPATFLMEVETVPNDWFAIEENRFIEVLWVYTNRVKQWNDLLAADVREILGNFANPDSCKSFPHYKTDETGLDATHVNLLANLTAWCVADASNADQFKQFYENAAPAAKTRRGRRKKGKQR